jgi:hypothetical protein
MWLKCLYSLIAHNMDARLLIRILHQLIQTSSLLFLSLRVFNACTFSHANMTMGRRVESNTRGLLLRDRSATSAAWKIKLIFMERNQRANIEECRSRIEYKATKTVIKCECFGTSCVSNSMKPNPRDLAEPDPSTRSELRTILAYGIELTG